VNKAYHIYQHEKGGEALCWKKGEKLAWGEKGYKEDLKKGRMDVFFKKKNFEPKEQEGIGDPSAATIQIRLTWKGSQSNSKEGKLGRVTCVPNERILTKNRRSTDIMVRKRKGERGGEGGRECSGPVSGSVSVVYAFRGGGNRAVIWRERFQAREVERGTRQGEKKRKL